MSQSNPDLEERIKSDTREELEEPPLYKAEIWINIPHSEVSAFSKETNIIKKSKNVIEVTCNLTHEAIIIDR